MGYHQIAEQLHASKMAAVMEVRKNLGAVIEFVTIEEVRHPEIHSRLKNVYDTYAVDGSTVRRWASRVKAAETDPEDRPCKKKRLC